MKTSRRFLIEGSVIVFSILLAFWIDAWWEESQEREREVMLLQALLADLESMRRGFDDQRRYNEAILDAAKALLAAGASTEPELGPADVDDLLKDILWYNSYTTWESAAMDILVSSGDLADLSDLNLVRLLLRLHNRLESAQRRCRLDEAFYRERLVPVLGDAANLPQILARIEHAPGVEAWDYQFPAVEFAQFTDHTGLITDPKFLALLAAKIDLQHDIMFYTLEDLDDQLDEVIGVLVDNLGD